MSSEALAQYCPDPALFTSAVASSIEPIELPPYEQMPALDGQSCADSEPPTWCSSSFGYPPYGGSTTRGKLFLWLVGRGNTPEQAHFVPVTAAYAGYHVVNLAYDNEEEIGSWCLSDGLDACDSGCQFAMAEELIFGVDEPATSYPGDPMHSVEGRLRLAIEDLHDMDVNDDGVDDDDWGAYCAETDASSAGPDLQWHLMEVGGFSFGGQVSSYISYIEPGVEPAGVDNTIGHFAVDGGAPTCDLDLLTATPSGVYFPDEMGDHTNHPPCGETLDPGDTGLTTECPPTDRFMVGHDEGLVALLLPYVDSALDQVSFDMVFTEIDADVTAGTIDLTVGNLLRTDQVPVTAGAYHECVAIDRNMPSSQSTAAPSNDANEYFLMPLYLDILCEIDQ